MVALVGIGLLAVGGLALMGEDAAGQHKTEGWGSEGVLGEMGRRTASKAFSCAKTKFLHGNELC